MKTTDKRKITTGFVIQTFDDDNKCIEQEFVAGDQVEWEDTDGNPIDSWSEYQPFDMAQPQAMAVVLTGNVLDGFGAIGPFLDFDEASRWTGGQDSWILVMRSPYEKT